MADPSATPPPINIPNFLGGYLMVNCLALILYGVTTTQTYIYTLNFKKDTAFLKGLVYFVWTLETFHTAFMLRQLYYLTITGFGDFDVLGRIDWSIGAFLLVESCLIWVVQAQAHDFIISSNQNVNINSRFYIRRIWLLSGKKILPVVFLSLVFVTCVAFHMTASIYTFLTDTWIGYFETFGATLSVETANALSAALDGLIAASMIFLLYRSQTGIQRTDGILRWLMVYAVNTGAVTMIFSIAIAITYALEHESLVVSGMTTIVSKLYANSFLGYLNARGIIRAKSQKSTALTVIGSSGFELPAVRSGSSGNSTSPPAQRLQFNHDSNWTASVDKEQSMVPELEDSDGDHILAITESRKVSMV
ncbi:hypothetical protein QCA50_004892 [Cerrena zonata]|uniref:DUF6534 domain-containing protein n=1 Tax=Cerrena zonata TaxID=2478898 RepID=A0AAW0GDB1_9APHY